MTWHTSRNPACIYPFSLVGGRVCISVYSGGAYWGSFSQLKNWHYSSWHVLCCSSFSLRFIYRGSIRYLCRSSPLIPSFYRANLTSPLVKNSLLYNIRRSKSDLFPATFLRISRYAPALLRLPWCLSDLKRYLICRVHNLVCGYPGVYFYYLGVFCKTATDLVLNTFINFNRMTAFFSPRWA